MIQAVYSLSDCFGITHFIVLIFYSISPKVKKKAVLVVRSCQLEIIVTRALHTER